MTPAEFKKLLAATGREWNKRKNPAHPTWEDAKFDMCDASTCVRMKPEGSVLIHFDGSPQKNNIILPPVLVKLIVSHYRDKQWTI